MISLVIARLFPLDKARIRPLVIAKLLLLGIARLFPLVIARPSGRGDP